MLKVNYQIDYDELQTICIRDNLYTCGTCEQYEDMFNWCRQYKKADNKDAVLEKICVDIVNHSSDKAFDNMGAYTYEERVELVAFIIMNECLQVYAEYEK